MILDELNCDLMHACLFCVSETICILTICILKIPLLQKPSDAFKEAAKMQAYEAWLPSGVLTRRSQDYPLEPCIMETVHSGTGMVFEGWSKKVNIYLHPFSEII